MEALDRPLKKGGHEGFLGRFFKPLNCYGSEKFAKLTLLSKGVSASYP
jgi:hypothetical protein